VIAINDMLRSMVRGVLTILLGAEIVAACGHSSAAVDAPPTMGSDAASVPPGPPSAVEAAPVPSIVSTLAGTGSAGSANGVGSAATFYEPSGVAVDGAGNVYVADTLNRLVREITSAGEVSTLAGTGSIGSANGSDSAASFFEPEGVAVDATGNIYVADTFNQLIREITPAGAVSTLAGTGSMGSANGSAAQASFNAPRGLAVDVAGNVYVGDTGNNLIRMITPAGEVSTLAGTGSVGSANGSGIAASFNGPRGVAVDGAGSLDVADYGNNVIRRVTPGGVVTTLAGTGSQGSANGPASAATFFGPTGVAVDADGNVYIADNGNNLIRVVTSAGVSTMAGTGSQGRANGSGSTASFAQPFGLALDASRNVYVGDTTNCLIREITSFSIGQLAVTWSPPSETEGSAITSYTATASATGQVAKSCTTDTTSCTISGLTSGVAYAVSVSATNAAGEGAPSPPVVATPN
jgi:sugar lactone lactonase YvrE